MKIIGLTGPTGAGKSSLKAVAENLGFKVIDCDKTARKATIKNSDGLKALVKGFGEDILMADGNLNRPALAKKAFASTQSTEKLNKILLPIIADLVLEESEGELVLWDAPTLFESGLNQKCTATVAVLADQSARLERIIARDGITKEQAKLRINAGKPDSFYTENANYIIYNNGNTAEFQKEFEGILNDIKER